MVRPDLNTWGHSLADLRRLAVNAQHPRSRERLLALYMIASQQTNATTWAAHIGHTSERTLDPSVLPDRPAQPYTEMTTLRSVPCRYFNECRPQSILSITNNAKTNPTPSKATHPPTPYISDDQKPFLHRGYPAISNQTCKEIDV